MEKITIIIPCKDDNLVLKCIDSIDIKSANILVVFNGSPRKFVKRIKLASKQNKAVSFIELKYPNLSWALEKGTRKAKSDVVLYMDSDCIFAKQALSVFVKIAQSQDLSKAVYKGDVVFSSGNNYIEKIIAKSRTHHTAEVLTAYKPPLMVSRKIMKKIGGYVFDDRLIWREDSDLDNRIRQAGIKIFPAKDAIIYHKSITLKTDLRSTFRYGVGLAIANSLNIKLTEVPRSVLSTFRSQGAIPALYMVFRNRIYNLGYWYTIIRIRLGFYKISTSPNIDKR